MINTLTRLLCINILLCSCSLANIDAPLPQTHEIWTKPGYSKEMVNVQSRACGNYSPDITYEQYASCMTIRGFKYNSVRGW